MDRLESLSNMQLARMLSEFLAVIQETQVAMHLMPDVPNLDIHTFMTDVELIRGEQARRRRAREQQSRRKRAERGGA